MAVGEFFLAAFLQVLFDRLASRELLNFARQEGIIKKLEKWRKTLRTIEAVLTDAEDKQLTIEAVKVWLDDLRDLAYDVEDILDEFANEALGPKSMVEPQGSTSKVQNLIPSCFTSLSPNAVKFSFSMGSKIKNITTRLEEISERRIQLGLEKIAGGTSRANAAPASTCYPIEPVYGRGQDEKKIVDLLLRDEVSGVNFCVLAIVGMGGLGKTTLAGLVYQAVQEFHPKAWVCVSDKFDVTRITKAILESVTFQPCDLKELNQVQGKLREALAGKRFLLVLDDVWNMDYRLWEALKSPFMAAAPGSKIVVTTRHADVALMMGPIEYYRLEFLSDDDCWSVFLKHAFENRDIGAHPNLESFRVKIVEKCKGLPLVATTLGGLLRYKLRDDEWEDILNNKTWNLSENENNVLPVLRLSYYHLPSHLKRCFAYCAIFPKDYEFEEKELVRLWMAEGFIQQSEGDKQMEELGGEYFRELLSRSIFQQSTSSSRPKFVMHDSINDLAQWVAGETCFKLEDDLWNDKRPKGTERARHSSYIRYWFDGIRKFEAFQDLKCLRTFLPLSGDYDDFDCFITNDVLLHLLPKLKMLRVLSFSGYFITELPDSIGDLKHLRYLNLSRTKIKSLPESTSSLYNLLSLILTDCTRLQKLPSKMENLINLRHLDITNIHLLTEMPIGIKELKLLRTLSDFILGKDNGGRINELMNFKFLCGTLCISNLENVIDANDAREANLNEKQDLDAVVMKWSSKFDNSRDAEIEKDVLDKLRPHQKLKELTIKCYAGNGFPTWLGDPSFSCIELLRLENCEKCTSLPPLGQLSSLKVLEIKGLMGVKSVRSEFYGNSHSKPFPSLESLRFEDMQEWEIWNASEVEEQVGGFPCLLELSILKCRKLTIKLPGHLPSLEELVIHECEQLVISNSSLPKLCRLEIDRCEEVVDKSGVDFSSLNSMVLSKISRLMCITEGFMRGLRKVENLEIGGGCEELIWKWLPCTLEFLTFRGCESLERLPKALYSLTSLRELNIYGCPNLIFVSKTSLLSSLYKLQIMYCYNLETLVDDDGEDSNLSSTSTSLLEYLYIESCPSLKCLSSRGMLPTSLRHLEIKRCPEMESITETFHNNTSLERIEIFNCKKLKSLPEGLHNLSHLHRIELSLCPRIVSFPEGGLPTANLRELPIRYCKKLEVLPIGMHNLNSLQLFYIWDCPSIASLPEEGFPTNLTSLFISNLNFCKLLFEWGLHRLNSLKYLSIRGGSSDMVSFPQEEIGMMLPISLTSLYISDFPNLKYLFSNGFWNLTSLLYLWISNCPNLISLPKKGLPPSLLQLYISRCPLLKQRCKRDRGQDWSKIAHIPCVMIDGKFIYEEE